MKELTLTDQQIQQAIEQLRMKGYKLSSFDLQAIPELLRSGSTLEEIEELYLF